MEKDKINPKDLIFSLDIGTRSIIGTVGVVRDKKLEVICERYKEHEERAMIDGQIHDINLVASVVASIKKDLEYELGCELQEVALAAAGRFLRTCECRENISLNGDEEIDKDMIRGLELGAVKKAENEVNKNTDGKLYCVGYSVKNFYLNSYVISNLIGHKGEEISAEVIATFLPRSVVDSLYTVMNKVGLKVTNLTLEPIAAIEAAVPQNLRLLNIALVDIGAGTSDIAISSKETISSYGMVPMAGDEITEVIAQEYLVDFNTAEDIKRNIENTDEITYTDVLGIENTISSENIKKLIAPTVVKLAEAISDRILDINGGKSPSAVFLVGGGAHTYGIIEGIANRLGLPIQRIAIKDRNAIKECICPDELGSAGVTVIGIALNALRSMGNDFIDVFLNGNPISLFNAHKHTVMDVLLQAGINSSLLIAKNGKSLRFKLNGKKRLVFGELGKNAKITINKKKATLETEVNAGDKIKVVYAQPGKDAAPKILDQIDSIDSIGIYFDGSLVNLEPLAFSNEKERKLTSIIKDGESIDVIFPKNILLFKKYIIKKEQNLYKDGMMLNDEYILCDGDEIYSKEKTINEEEVKSKEVASENKGEVEGLKLYINGEEKYLSGKNSFMFLDVFNVIDIDLTVPKGNINLILNGKTAAFTDKLNTGDNIEVFWS